ncbi:MAG: ATP synthase gamma chain [Candidatus Woesebacteria bacterium GW2011_GWB1_43_14]|uniref:ATP synthase gamma chain n=1 Tax=Candidatus Woesebacteria bacterium GW2011_GWB1_43_14 TaxID=1618578 RepID=A0A0G1FPE0_9BACT|nr:MAG: ATP synthase gamma chain [Candidatus Woesebacteria bacterium GW2011_GWC1_42_9]KKS96896.1 MAG: ATP synthase gamma chain [Candidatus Woesebacteria bacterium GW2011_GWB1_43_14]
MSRGADNTIKDLESMKEMTQALAEIAANRMRKTRNSVLRSREYMAEINGIFDEVRASYRRAAAKLLKRRGKKKGGELTFLAHNGKTVAVLISANAGLYGEIVHNTFNFFLENIKGVDNEVTIIGKLGQKQFLGSNLKLPYTYFDFPDYGLDKELLVGIIEHLVQYEEIHFYYGRYINVVRQEPTRFNLSAQTPLSKDIGEKKEVAKYIFEPSLENILMTFESKIFGSLIEQTIEESQLAKNSSRIMSMQEASDNIAENIKKEKIAFLRMRHRVHNQKRLNSLSGMSLWSR